MYRALYSPSLSIHTCRRTFTPHIAAARMPTFPPLRPSLWQREGFKRNPNSIFSFVINSHLPPDVPAAIFPTVLRAVAPCGEVLSHETARATPTAADEPRHHSRRGRYPRTPTAASCSAVVASTSSNTLRSLARRGTLFLPRRSIQRANVPAGTTCISGGAIVLRRLAS